MTARIDEACGEENTLKNTGLRSETMRRKMEGFLRVVLGMRKQIYYTPGWAQAGVLDTG